MMRSKIRLQAGWLLVAVFVLAACGGGSSPLVDIAPVDDARPTFLYFYTDN